MAAATPTPLVTTPCKVVDTANLTISEYFGHVASKDGTCSFAVVEVSAADNAAFQTPAFAEYVRHLQRGHNRAGALGWRGHPCRAWAGRLPS